MAKEAARNFVPIQIAVLTVSDTRTAATDRSGDTLMQRITSAGHVVPVREVVRDDADAIEAVLRRWVSDPQIDAVISTGGTGITGRDVTPEAFARVIEKELPGFGELFRMISYEKIGSSAMLSRAVGGVAGGTYLFALPGSTGSVIDAWDNLLGPQFDTGNPSCGLAELIPRLRER